MKYAFYTLAVILALTGVRLTNRPDILPQLICVGLAILCFYCAMIIDSLKENNKFK